MAACMQMKGMSMGAANDSLALSQRSGYWNLIATACLQEQRRKGTSKELLLQYETLLPLLQQFIWNQPALENQEFFLALERAHHLIPLESDPTKYLQRHGLNIPIAAYSLLLYWKQRVTVFGERAFRPVSALSDGALSREAVKLAVTGYISFLPNSKYGNTVMCLQPIRRSTDDWNVRLEAVFYIGHIISENPISQTDGIIAIVLAFEEKFRKGDGGMAKLCDALFTLFPAKCKCLHIFDCRPPSTYSWITHGFVKILLERFHPNFQRYQTYLHPINDKDKVIRELEVFGLSKHGLPSIIGGNWVHDETTGWTTGHKHFDSQSDSLKVSSPLLSAQGQKVETHSKIISDLGNSPPELVLVEGKVCRKVQPSDIENLEQELLSLEKSESEIYFKAVSTMKPEVWLEEVRRQDFLSVESYDFNRAAKRLAAYWRLRYDCFASKAFESMNQTGEAALIRSDLILLQTGFLMLLPNDKYGRSVLSIDSTKLPDVFDTLARDRCLFYMISLLAENEMSHKEGAVLIINVEKPTFGKIDADFMRTLEDYMPVRFKAIHLISFHHEIPSIEGTIHIYDKQAIEEVSLKLQSGGIAKEGQPNYLGGEWGYEKFVEWQELRTRMEWKIPVGLTGRDSEKAFSLPAIRPYKIDTSLDPVERRRRLNVIHTRRKRERFRVAINALQEHVNSLNERRKDLLSENARLEGLNQSAQWLVVSNQDNSRLELLKSPCCGAVRSHSQHGLLK